ncbi:BZ3500_MvSof-1268-A1-R1_Chr1-1g00953 [Microbotryum saponariae]|uniref:BZ3500_MvSof-1268-A1-R1_Chr1-1g00953 protein n=1 Tax=Microbotryum saponariae TaxID=289078 RepID=A0A2X0KJS3_9BASI|nr:BZ3500_MvSof-1268-A1-R1_Chr1-1g00953 [Microbotryum saponariae]SCZ93017.1 BZ3501_MvSof-1269-A2-R1_Chr1-1g00550 [Microbotryum saponariae]
MRLPLLSSVLLFASLARAALKVNVPSLALANLLQPAAPATIRGQTVVWDTFALTILANTSHAVVSFEIPVGVNLGWMAVGFGSAMKNSAMVVLWPSQDRSRFVLSPRASPDGWALPVAYTRNFSAYFQQVDAFDLISTDAGYRASFIRPLTFPPSQDVFPATALTALALDTPNPNQPIIVASSVVPPTADDPRSPFTMHDHKSILTMNLAKPYLNKKQLSSESPNTGGNNNSGPSIPVDTSDDEDKFPSDTLILIMAHANLAIVVWTLVAPIGILVPRFCRAHPKWFGYHATFQGWIVFPFTIVIVVFGMLAGHPPTDTMTRTHQLMGLTLGALLLLQVTLGLLARRTLPPVETSAAHYGGTKVFTRSLPQVIHMVMGVSILLLGFAQTQVGLALYAHGTLAMLYLSVTLGCAGIFLLLFLSSLVQLVRTRHREGRSWSKSIFGLGRTSASKPRLRINLRPMNDSRPSFVMEGGPNAPPATQQERRPTSLQSGQSIHFSSLHGRSHSATDYDNDTKALVPRDS